MDTWIFQKIEKVLWNHFLRKTNIFVQKNERFFSCLLSVVFGILVSFQQQCIQFL